MKIEKEDQKLDYHVSTNLDDMDFSMLHDFLSQTYWSKGIPKETLQKSLDNSLCFGIFFEGQQIGFARMVTDYSIFAYLADVFILPAYRGRGFSKKLLDEVFDHSDLQGLRRMTLVTRDAQGLYERYGFKAIKSPDMHMENWNPDCYVVDSED